MRRVIAHFVLMVCCCVAWSASAADPYLLTNQWAVEMKTRSDSSPAIGPDGTIYLGTFDGKLWAIAPEGSRKWVFQARREIRSSPAVGVDGTVYFGSRDCRLYAVSPEGRKIWEMETGWWVDASPAIGSDGTVYCGSWDSTFYAVKPDGGRKWVFNAGAEITSSAAIDGEGRIFFGAHNGKLYALDAAGAKVWEFTAGAAIVTSPALDEKGGVCFSSVDGFLYCLNSDGSLRWKLRTGGVTESSPVLGEDGIFFIGVNRALWAVGPDGKKIWDRFDGELIDAAPTALSNGTACWSSRVGQALCVNMKKELQWYYNIPGQGYASPGVDAAGRLFLMSGSALHALPQSVPLAQTPWPKFRGNSRNTGNVRDR